MGCQKVARIILLILSLVFSLAGVAILGAGVFQPYWQHVDMRGMPGIDSEWFGLYEDCMHMTDNSQQAGWTCYYKWITHDSQLRIQLKEESWRFATFALIATAETCGAVALFLGICAFCNRFVSVAKAVFNFIAGFLGAVSLVLFYRNAHDAANEIYVYNGQTFKVSIGESFYLSIGGAMAFIIACFLSVGSSVLFFMEVKSASTPRNRRTFSKSHESTI